HHFHIHGVRQVHADGLFLEKFDFHDGIGNQVVYGFAQLVAGHLHLLERFRVHEMELVALVIEILEFDFVQDGAVHEFFCAEPVVDHDSVPQVFQARLHRTALVAGRPVVGAENSEKLALVLDHHAGAKLCGLNAAHKFVAPRRAAADSLSKLNSFRKFQTAALRSDAWNGTRHAGKRSIPNAKHQYNGGHRPGSIISI